MTPKQSCFAKKIIMNLNKVKHANSRGKPAERTLRRRCFLAKSAAKQPQGPS